MRTGRIAGVLGAAALASACGSSVPPASQTPPDLPNIGQIEGAIKGTIRHDDHVTAQVICPTSVPQIVGEVFSCIALIRHPKPEAFTFQVTEHGGTFVTYGRTS